MCGPLLMLRWLIGKCDNVREIDREYSLYFCNFALIAQMPTGVNDTFKVCEGWCIDTCRIVHDGYQLFHVI